MMADNRVKKKRIRRIVGDVVAVPIADGQFGFGVVLEEPLIGFYDLKASKIISTNDFSATPLAFSVWVMNHAITRGEWPVVGHLELKELPIVSQRYFKKDALTGKLTIYRGGHSEEIPATKEECNGLEAAAVWEPEHVVDRLNDHFARRPNKWVESLSP